LSSSSGPWFCWNNRTLQGELVAANWALRCDRPISSYDWLFQCSVSTSYISTFKQAAGFCFCHSFEKDVLHNVSKTFQGISDVAILHQFEPLDHMRKLNFSRYESSYRMHLDLMTGTGQLSESF
jgi:hypothetical protein